MLANRGDRCLLEQPGSDLLDLMAQPLFPRLVAQPPSCRREHDQVEALGVLVVVAHDARQVGEVRDNLGGRIEVQCLPRIGLPVALDPAPMRAHQEVVEVHAGDLVAEQRDGVLAQARAR